MKRKWANYFQLHPSGQKHRKVVGYGISRDAALVVTSPADHHPMSPESHDPWEGVVHMVGFWCMSEYHTGWRGGRLELPV
eukprot:scaffold40872_cov64-Attheya_sp.AAC.2